MNRLSQQCSQPDAATKQYRPGNHPYRGPAQNSVSPIGLACRLNPLSGLRRRVANVLYHFLPEQSGAIAHPLCKQATGPNLDILRGLFKFSCGGSDLLDDFVGRLLQDEAVQRDHRHNWVIWVDPDSMFDRDLCGELL